MDNMKREKLEEITKNQSDLKNLPNTRLIEMLDFLSQEFDDTKEHIIKMTYYLDNIEILYNNVLKEHENRNI
jgi:hypothetical protein